MGISDAEESSARAGEVAAPAQRWRRFMAMQVTSSSKFVAVAAAGAAGCGKGQSVKGEAWRARPLSAMETGLARKGLTARSLRILRTKATQDGYYKNSTGYV